MKKTTPTTARAGQPQAARYIGDGGYLPGVPTRDLSAAEWAAISVAQREQALNLNLYQLVSEPTQASATEAPAPEVAGE